MKKLQEKKKKLRNFKEWVLNDEKTLLCKLRRDLFYKNPCNLITNVALQNESKQNE